MHALCRPRGVSGQQTTLSKSDSSCKPFQGNDFPISGCGSIPQKPDNQKQAYTEGQKIKKRLAEGVAEQSPQPERVDEDHDERYSNAMYP